MPLPDRLRVKKSSGSTEQSEELPAYVPDSQKMEVIIMKLVPLGDRVVLKQLEAETTLLEAGIPADPKGHTG